MANRIGLTVTKTNYTPRAPTLVVLREPRGYLRIATEQELQRQEEREGNAEAGGRGRTRAASRRGARPEPEQRPLDAPL
jgi:hypothetical protein